MRSQTGRGAVACAMLVPTLAFAEPAGAPASTGLALSWSDPNGLAPTTDREFARRLSERLGQPAFDDSASEHTLSVTWLGSAEQCRVELQLLHGSEVEGTRELESPSGDCRTLTPALLTVAALLIESERSEPDAPQPAPKAVPATAAAPPPAAGNAHPPPAHDAKWLLSLGAELGSGLAPKLEQGAAAALTYAPIRQLRIGAAGALFLPHQYGAAPGMELAHRSGRLLACGMPLGGTFALGACASAALHRWASAGISLPHPEAHRSYAWTAGVALRAEWRLVPHLWWVGSVGADISPAPLYFYFTKADGGASILFRQQRVAPSFFLGLTLEP